MKDRPDPASDIPVFAVADGKDKLTLFDRLEDAQNEAQRLNVEVQHLKCARGLFDDEGGFPVELQRPPDDEPDYEPEYDLDEARLGLKHMYRVSPTYREFSDRLWADGQATARRWRETAESDAQLRLPLIEFCPWMWFERPNPDANED